MPRPKKTDSSKPEKPKTTKAKAKTTKPTTKSADDSKSLSTKEIFPHVGFSHRLEYMDGKDKKICFFQCANHMEKHIARHKLNRKNCKISVKED